MAKTRSRSSLRDTRIYRYPTAAAGSVIIEAGKTKVLCTASLEADVPRWMKKTDGVADQGWVTAEYSMLPGSTPDRKRRGTDGRGTEIQRLIGRSLRAAVDMKKMPGITIMCDCDVLVADGGTRTASITGAWVALHQALEVARKKKLIAKNPLKGPVAAISVGKVDGKSYLDLDYVLDVAAEVDMNVVMNHKGEFIELQGTGEGGIFTRSELDELVDLAGKGIKKLMKLQREAIKE